MFDWVPLSFYNEYFHIAVLICILIAIWQCHVGSILQKDVATLNAVWGCTLCIILILYMGLRPISSEFGDTMNYAKYYQEHAAAKTYAWKWETEWLYYNLLGWWGHMKLDLHQFFLMNAIVYVGALWLATVRIFKNYYYLPLLVVFAMFTFWAYGTNGLRNGMASSLFILALTYTNNLPAMGLLFITAVGCHTSTVLLIGAAAIAWFIKNSYIYLMGWIACLGLSYGIGGRIQTMLAAYSLFNEDERFNAYLTGSNARGEIVQLAMTFRWDFVAYSALGVAIGYYFIFRRNYKDEYYHWLYNIFLTTNAFWLLIIRANYSNRFAQISWFIMPLILIYPFMKKRFWANHEKMLSIALLIFYAFAFYTNIWQPGVLRSLLY